MRNVKANTLLFIAIINCFFFSTQSNAAPGDIIETIEINNIAANAGDINQPPITPHGITFYDGYMWAMDFGTDRIYRIYTTDTVDTFGNPVSAGDSDFNIPVSEITTPQLPNGDNMPVCGAYPGDQYCGGGGLVNINGFLWNASPITDNILKIDPTDGGTITSEHLFTNHSFPSPSSLTHDGTHFWVIDWQSNTISKVLAETGEVLAEYDGPDNSSDPRPTGITWDGLDLWLSYEAEEKIYRVRPTNTPPLLDVLDFFDAPGAIEGGSRPKDLTWDGEFLWHSDAGTGKVYKLETDIMPFGITGCIQKNGIGIGGGVLLSQPTSADQSKNTDSDGCFSFPQFIPGASIVVELNESGVNGKPFIQLNETNTNSKYASTAAILIQNQTPYNESNFDFTATDPEEGNLHSSVTATPNVIDNPGLIDISVVNDTGYIIQYNAIDSDGNDADPVYRTIYVLPPDITPPELNLNGSSSILIEQDLNNANLYIEAGAQAIDNRDGDITDNIVITGSVNSSIAATYTITYTVSDAAGNTSTADRTIEVKDTTAPEITIIGNNPLEIEKGDTYNEAGASVVDNIEGTITLSASHITGSVDTNTVGTYTINYSYSDNGGNTATTNRTVNVIDTGAPIITLRGSATINHELNTPYTDAGASAEDDTGETISANVPFTGSVNTTSIGTYTLTFNISDASGNAAPSVTRQVTVDDTGAPSITLNGNQTINLQKGDTYSELGATATDSVDNDATLTANITISGTVDTNTNGTYTLDYNVSDTAGNAATPVIRTVNVSDTGSPVITLIGNNIMTIEQGSSFIDPGATATDAVDNDATLTTNISVSGSVNTGVLDNYTLSYNVSDSSGNSAATVIRTVQVVAAADTTPPVITLSGSNVISIQQNTTFTDPGASATDNIDNNASLTANILVSGIVNTGIVGSYTLSYNVSDAAGNAATTVTRTVNVTIAPDTTPPTITLFGSNNLNVAQNATFTDPGAQATDNIDNNTTLTSSILVSGSVNTSVLGSYTLSYNVSDTAGNAATTVTRTINVIATADTTPPVITLLGSNNITIQQNTSFTDPGAQATDNIDNTTTITANIVVNGSVNTASVGNYSLSYDVFDAAGNAAPTVSRTVQVIAAADTTPPTITLLGDNPLELTVGDTYNEPGYSANDDVDGNITGSVVVNSSAVNTNIIGSYSITYTVSDNASNSVTVTRTVNISAAPDTTPPTIMLLGDNPLEIIVDGNYNEPGYSATDNVDGTITGNVTVNTSSVNTNAIGSYSVTYNVSDTAGNAAATMNRTVNVTAAPDTTPPVITLLGDNPLEITVGGNYNEQGATATDNVDVIASGSITINSSAVNTNAIGSYSVSYNVSDTANNNATTVMRTVNVIAIPDTTPPTLSLLGDNPQEIVLGGTYIEQGANASDNVDVINSGSIVINSSAINTGIIGSYTVTYDVSDTAGNNATTKTRTVNVVSATTTYSASPALAVGAASISTTLNIADNKQIADLNVFIDMPHAYPGDVSIILTSPSGTAVTILDGPGIPASQYGCSNDDFLVTLDDEGTGNAEDTCTSPPALSGTLIPNNALSAFDGESSQGTWTLRLDDSYTGSDTGTLNNWSLIITQ